STGAREAVTVALNGAEDGVKRLSGAVFRRRIARLAESGNLAWSAAAFIISLIVLLPIIDLYRVTVERRYLATSRRQRASGCVAPHARADGRRRSPQPPDRYRHGLARHHVPFPGTQSLAMAASAAPCRPDLHHRLFLSRAARLFRHRADKLARAVRLAKRAQLLVPRHQEPTRRDLRYERRALSLCVHHRAGKFRRAVSLRARGEPYVGPDRLPDLLASRLAAGQASACRRRGACTDGDAK